MKAVILAGGLGTRLSEETSIKPKPMVEIGGKPILWHIMKIYSEHGINEFIVCCGYKGYLIKEFFSNFYLHNSDFSVDLKTNKITIENNATDPWNVTLVDTGEETMTGGRLARVKKYIENEDCFCFTYGDGVSNIDISKLIEFHKEHGRDATLTAVRPPGKFGAIKFGDNGYEVSRFEEKPDGDGAWINGGFFVLSPKVLERIESDNTIWEQQPLVGLSNDNQLCAFKHDGFWQPMDTLREKNYLNELWNSNKAPWKIW